MTFESRSLSESSAVAGGRGTTDLASSLSGGLLPIALGIACGSWILVLSQMSAKLAVLSLGMVFFAAAVAFTGNIRVFLWTFVIVGIPLGLDVHLTYRDGHVGLADGLVVGPTHIGLFALLVLGVWDRRRHGVARPLWFPSLAVPLLVLLLAGAVSFVNTPDAQLSIYGMVAWSFFAVFCLFLAGELTDPGNLERASLLLAACLVIPSLYCLFETAMQTNYTLTLQPRPPNPDFPTFRASGLSASPNATAGYLAGLIPLVLARALSSRSRLVRLVLLAAVALGMSGLLLTLSRGATMSLAVGLAAGAVLAYQKKLVRLRHLVLAMALIVLPAIAFRAAISTRVSEGSENLSARTRLLYTAWNMIEDHPLTGVGLNTYSVQMEDYTPGEFAYDFLYQVHNQFMLVWAETGTLGLLAFVALFLLGLKNALAASRAPSRGRALTAIGVFMAIIVLGVHMQLEAYAGGPGMMHFGLLIALAAALARIAPRESETALL